MKSFYTYFSLFAVGFLLCSFANISFDDKRVHEDGYVRWDERKLSWSDFKGTVPNDSKFHASTQSAINFNYKTENQTVTFNIESIFDPTASWKKENVNNYILEHEQIHFDITEYHTRLLREALKNKEFHSFASIDREVRELYDYIHLQTKAMQEEYDHETEHALNKKMQSKWARKLKRLLRKTTDFNSPVLKLDISYLEH